MEPSVESSVFWKELLVMLSILGGIIVYLFKLGFPLYCRHKDQKKEIQQKDQKKHRII